MTILWRNIIARNGKQSSGGTLKREGDRDERKALIARAKQKIGETKLQISTTKDQRLNEVLTQLRETQKTLANNYEQLRTAEDV